MRHNPKQIRIEKLPLNNPEQFNSIIKDINNWIAIYNYDIIGMAQTPYQDQFILTITYRECCSKDKEKVHPSLMPEKII